MAEDVLDIILRLSNLQRFVAGTRQAAASVGTVGDAAARSNEKSAASSKRMAGAAGLIGKAAMGTAVAAAGIAYESTKMSIEFDKQMQMIHTQAGARQSEVATQSRNVLNMASSGNFAQGPVELAKGLFHLESIGLRAKNAINGLRIAAQGAAVGNSDLESTTTALGAAWLTGIRGTTNLRTVMAALNATVGAGNMRMQSLVDSLGTGVLPAAKLAGLGLRDVMSALALLSDEGYHGYSAMAQFATSLHFITDPGKKATDALDSIRLSQTQLANTMRSKGLLATLTQLHDHLAKFGGNKTQQNQVLGNILPAGRGRILEVLLNNYERLMKKNRQIAANTKNYTNDIAATHRTAAFKIHAAWAMIQADMIKVGHVLQPVAVFFAQGVAKVAGWLLKLPQIISKLVSDPKGGLHGVVTAIQDIGRYAQQVFSGSFVRDLSSIGHVIGNVVSTIGHVLGRIGNQMLPHVVQMFRGGFAIIAGIVKFVASVLTGHFGRAFGALKGIVSGAIRYIGGALGALFVPIRMAANFIWTAISGAFNRVVRFVGGIGARIGAAASGIWNGLKSDLVDVINWIIRQINHVIDAINSVASSIPVIGGNVASDIQQIGQAAATVPTSGLNQPSAPRGSHTSAPGHQPGAVVRHLVRSSAFGRTSGVTPVAVSHFEITVPVKIGNKEVARATGKAVSDKRARR